MTISLSPEQRAALSAQGVVIDERGFLRSAGGREVSGGAAEALLKGMSPGRFQRPCLHEGHAAESAGPGDLAKMTPQVFRRHYLAAGHAAESPANTGQRAATVVPETAHQAEPEDFHRGYLTAGHTTPSPGNHGPNNPNVPGAAAGEVYASGAAAYEGNQSRARAEHVMASQAVRSEPSVSRAALPADMRAARVLADRAVQATRAAPGERGAV